MSVPKPTAGMAPDPWARGFWCNGAYRGASYSYSRVLAGLRQHPHPGPCVQEAERDDREQQRHELKSLHAFGTLKSARYE